MNSHQIRQLFDHLASHYTEEQRLPTLSGEDRDAAAAALSEDG